MRGGGGRTCDHSSGVTGSSNAMIAESGALTGTLTNCTTTVYGIQKLVEVLRSYVASAATPICNRIPRACTPSGTLGRGGTSGANPKCSGMGRRKLGNPKPPKLPLTDSQIKPSTVANLKPISAWAGSMEALAAWLTELGLPAAELDTTKEKLTTHGEDTATPQISHPPHRPTLWLLLTHCLPCRRDVQEVVCRDLDRGVGRDFLDCWLLLRRPRCRTVTPHPRFGLLLLAGTRNGSTGTARSRPT